MQQHLPPAVLKHNIQAVDVIISVYKLQQHLPFTVLKRITTVSTNFNTSVATTPTVCGIETTVDGQSLNPICQQVATTPTACGIETYRLACTSLDWTHRLQQHLPLAVLKPILNFAVINLEWQGCNNTYRLRYAPKGARQQRSEVTMRPTHCLPERREGKTKVISNSTYRLRY